jgi:hypothetical protein
MRAKFSKSGEKRSDFASAHNKLMMSDLQLERIGK